MASKNHITLCFIELLSLLGPLCACNETSVLVKQVDQEGKSLSLSHAKISGIPLAINLAFPSVTYQSNQRQERRHSRETLLLAMGLLSPGKDEEDELS